MTSIKLQEIHKRYKGNDHFALRDINVTMPAGSLTAIVGPSGCGKTTLLKIIAGLEMADAGDIIHNSDRINALPAHRRQTVMLLQRPLLFPYLSVYENIAFGLRVRKMAEDEIRQRVMDILRSIGLPGFAERRPDQLSGGEQQRVSLARAVVTRPKILLLDEPLTNLDRYLWREMARLIAVLHAQYNLTTVLVTHNHEEALILADRLVFMINGIIEQIGMGHELYNHPATVRVARFFDTQNIFTAHKRGTRITLGALHLTITSRQASQCPDGDIYLCIRPEAIAIVRHELPSSSNSPPNPASPNTIKGELIHTHFNGAQWNNIINVDGNEWVCLTTEPIPAASHAAISICLPPQQMSLFDAS